MLMSELGLGVAVELATELSVFNLGTFPAGSAGIVDFVDPNAGLGEPIVHVRMDAHFPSLDDWDNCLQIFLEEDETSEVTPSKLRPRQGFY